MAPKGHRKGEEEWMKMGLAIKAIVILGLLGVAIVAGYAYLGDMTPEAAQTQVPVELDASY